VPTQRSAFVEVHDSRAVLPAAISDFEVVSVTEGAGVD
jgi:hypothetical protein